MNVQKIAIHTLLSVAFMFSTISQATLGKEIIGFTIGFSVFTAIVAAMTSTLICHNNVVVDKSTYNRMKMDFERMKTKHELKKNDLSMLRKAYNVDLQPKIIVQIDGKSVHSWVIPASKILEENQLRGTYVSN